MNPLSIGTGALGLGLTAYGAFSAAQDAKQIAALDREQAGLEQGINAQKRVQMELDSKRAQLQNVRNAQRLRAQATAAATNQGANMGSGLQGGLSQITGMANWNAMGLDQNLDIGRNIFALNDQISDVKMRKATVQGDMATDQAIMSLGGSLVNNSGTIGKFFG